MENEEQFLTLSSAARLAMKSEATIRQAEKRGKLPASRTSTGIRLFKASDVRAFVAAQKPGGVKKIGAQVDG
jgi:hypothetical protein